jgi:hypothetical protein
VSGENRKPLSKNVDGASSNDNLDLDLGQSLNPKTGDGCTASGWRYSSDHSRIKALARCSLFRSMLRALGDAVILLRRIMPSAPVCRISSSPTYLNKALEADASHHCSWYAFSDERDDFLSFKLIFRM